MSGKSPTDPIESYLYDGEKIRERLESKDTDVAVTTHRVIVYSNSPGTEKAFRHADLPNVDGVRRKKRGNTAGVRRGIRLCIYGVVSAVAGYLIRDLEFFDKVSEVDTSSASSVGQTYEFATSVIDAVQTGAEIALYGGIALFLVGVLLVLYLMSKRESHVVIELSGSEDPIELPASADVDVDRLRSALDQAR